MRSVVVLCARVDDATGRIEVAKEITNDDGSVEYNCHSFSVEALEWHAAQYDMADINEVIDDILFEPFAPPTDMVALRHTDERVQHLQRIRSAKTSLTPRNGNGNGAAKKARMRAAGIPDAFVDAVDVDARQVIRQACPFDPEVIQVKREHIGRLRERVQAPAAGPVDRVAGLRQRVAAPRNVTQQRQRGELPAIVLGEGDKRGAP